MAERRMIFKAIINSDAFLNMPQKTQNLYFHLVVRAKKEGLIDNIAAICRALKYEIKDLDLLLELEYITYLGPILYVTHWKDHCYSDSTSKKRLTYEYRKWRKEVLERDWNKCKECGSKTLLHVHHIKPFSIYKSLRTELSNGITLCKSCHIKIHKKMRGSK